MSTVRSADSTICLLAQSGEPAKRQPDDRQDHMNVLTGPFVCLACRKSFKRPRHLEAPACPDCGKPTVGLSEKFQAPPQKDVAAWKVVAFLIEHGFRYHSIRERTASGGSRLVSKAYPRTIEAAREFVVRYREHRVADDRS